MFAHQVKTLRRRVSFTDDREPGARVDELNKALPDERMIVNDHDTALVRCIAGRNFAAPGRFLRLHGLHCMPERSAVVETVIANIASQKDKDGLSVAGFPVTIPVKR